MAANDSQSQTQSVSVKRVKDANQPKASAKGTNQHPLDIRRKLEDRLERRRLQEELGCDDLRELDF